MQGALFGDPVPYEPPTGARPTWPPARRPVEPEPAPYHAGQLAAPVVPVDCRECGRTLKNPASITEGIGPVCKRKATARHGQAAPDRASGPGGPGRTTGKG